jgi:hypothetical protein
VEEVIGSIPIGSTNQTLLLTSAWQHCQLAFLGVGSIRSAASNARYQWSFMSSPFSTIEAPAEPCDLPELIKTTAAAVALFVSESSSSRLTD